MNVKVKRLYKGVSTIRSDQGLRAYNKGQNLTITCNGETMTIPHKDIKERIIAKSAPYPSKFNINQTYELWDYLWIPN